jgi:hypothetical protein
MPQESIGDAKLIIKLGDAVHLCPYKPVWQHYNAVFVADFNGECARRRKHGDLRMAEGMQKVVVEHIERVCVKQERRAFRDIRRLDVPIVEVSAADHGLESRFGRSCPERCVAAVRKTVKGESLRIDEAE